MTYPSSNKVVLIGKESTWGVSVTADKDVGVIQDITDDITREISEVMGLGSIETQQINSSNVEVNGSLTTKVNNGRLFEYIVGTVAHAETSGDWVHTFTINDNPPSFTLHSGLDSTTDTVLTHAGCLVENAELTITQTEELSLKVDFKSKTTASTAASSADQTSSLITFPKALVTITINAIAEAEIQEFTITFAKRVERSFGIGSNLPQQGHGTELKMQFAGKLGFSSKTFQELFLGGTAPTDTGNPTVFTIDLDADNGTALGSGQRRVHLILGNCIMNKFTETATIGELVFVDFAGSGTFTSMTSTDNISNVNFN